MEMNLNRILAAIAAFLFLLIVTVTAVSFAIRKARPGKNLRQADPEPGAVVNMTTPDNGKLSAFTGIGRIRTMTKPDPKRKKDTGTSVVVTPWFAYPEGDTDFYEELSRKSTAIQAIVAQYFSRYTEDELRSAGETKIKADILEELNSRFSLGKLTAVYFSDYIFLE
jgi:flagellar basal body-associated protein FliL